jgi:hypothetical protein
MSNLVAFMNDDSLCDADPLIKMAVIHMQKLILYRRSWGFPVSQRMLILPG